jgi:alkanesulfonate monooxygenase SsuD/methylene tetrahydromethanopterin reductase-like flavin-dependent oxidoreductase (luciferase family)
MILIQEAAMRVGISLTSAFAGVDFRDGARWMIERAAAANRSGLDSLFVGDHHSTGGSYYQNVPILGRLLAEWGDRSAGCLFLLPLWNPVLAAEQIGTLASIHQGRFILQCALGADARQFGAMGVNIKQRPSLFEESLDIIRRLLAGERVTGTRRFPFTEARVAPVAPEPIETWIGGSVEAAVDRAARLGDAWLGGPELSPERAKDLAAFYLERCASYGRVPTAVAIRRDLYVGESAAEARAVAEPIIAAGYRGFGPETLTYGNADEVAARFREYGAMGYTDVLIRHLTNDQPKVLGSLARLAEVRAAIAAV